MSWQVEFQDDFAIEFKLLPQSVQKKLLEYLLLLENRGSNLGRPIVDTLYNSTYPNMKELRYDGKSGAWRIAFAFDPNRCAILLVAGDKSGNKNFIVNSSRKPTQDIRSI